MVTKSEHNSKKIDVVIIGAGFGGMAPVHSGEVAHIVRSRGRGAIDR